MGNYTSMNLLDILRQIAQGQLTPEAGAALLAQTTEHNLGFACVDLDRLRRRGMPEVIFCPGKPADQISRIMTAMVEAGQNILATRASRDQYEVIRLTHPKAVFHEAARAVTLTLTPVVKPVGLIAVLCAGTSDIPVAEEAALSAECMGARVERLFDVGVAGLHRLLKHVETLRQARAVVVVAGMEGALPSVVGGLIDRPIIAVPTSVGYGVNLQGLAPLLTMLNSCVPGISVVNIDNGFGAGISAALINRLGEPEG